MSLLLTSALWFLYHRLLRRNSPVPPHRLRHALTHQPVKMVD